MKQGLTVLLLAAMLLLATCAKPTAAPVAAAPANAVTAGNLRVSVELPRRDFVVGESFSVTVTAVNLGQSAITIPAESRAQVFVDISRRTPLGWEELLRYPPAPAVVMCPWTLGPGQQRSFTLNLTVEPHWPTNELLYLSAELNGRPDAAPGIAITVSQPEQGAE